MATKNGTIKSFFKPISNRKSTHTSLSSNPKTRPSGPSGDSSTPSIVNRDGAPEGITNIGPKSHGRNHPSSWQVRLPDSGKVLPSSPPTPLSSSPDAQPAGKSESRPATPRLNSTIAVDGDIDNLSLRFSPSVKHGTPVTHGRTILKPKSRSQSPRFSSPPFRDPSSSPSLASSPPSLPVVKQKVGMDTEIPGSDDDDSDSSLWDDPLVPHRQTMPRAQVQSSRSQDPCVTPRAKRVAFSSHLSPPVSRPQHRFDMKTLLKHAERDKATEASSKRVDAIKLEEELPETEAIEASPNTKRKKFVDFAGLGDDDEATKEKMLRAMERTETGAVRSRWYFFDTTSDSPLNPQPPFPKQAAKGPWSLLSGSVKSRNQHIISGLPYSIASRNGLPDEIFVWVMNSLHATESAILRDEYRRLIGACPDDQLDGAITIELLQNVFRKLGTGDHLTDSKFRAVREVENVYHGRDWSALCVYLKLFSDLAGNLDDTCLVYLLKILLRLGVDKMLMDNPDVLVDYQGAITSLVDALPPELWNTFCTEVCSSLYEGFGKASFRVQPLLSLPIASLRVHELRRRLAVAFFLNDCSLAGKHPDKIFTLEDAMKRLKDAEFDISRRTDYVDLRAYILLLDMAIDNGSYPLNGGTPEDENKFNANVDALAKRLQSIWRSINDAGTAYMSRTEAKSVLERVQHRLTYSVRRRPPAKQSLFDVPEQDASGPKQTNLWKWYQKPRKPTVVNLSDDGEGETFVSAVDGLE